MGTTRSKIHRGSQPLNQLRSALERLYQDYGSRYLDSDPLKFPHRYAVREDQELVAFLSAAFAFGQVKSIFQSLEQLLSHLTPHPALAIQEGGLSARLPQNGAFHRWITWRDVGFLLSVLGEIYSEKGSLEQLFKEGLDGGSTADGIRAFSNSLRSRLAERAPVSRGLKFLIPDPSGAGAFKRMHLFLRWMVRTSSPDLGLWKCLAPSDLQLPIDIHLSRILRNLGLTRRKTVSREMVSEATQALKILDPCDPIRFDFSLSRLGILKECRHVFDARLCPKCPLKPLCIQAA